VPEQSSQPRALGYIRQSRTSEAAASPAAQKRAIEDFARSQGWLLVDVFSDIGRSGFDPKAHRPALDNLLSLLERGGVQRVIVWKLDRLTRRGIGEALAYVDRIKNAGAALVSVTEPFDTSTALGEGIFALLLSLARAESEKLSERVRSGKSIVRERGGWLGGPVPFGFGVERVERPGYLASRLVVDPVQAPIVREMVSRILQGGNARQVLQYLNTEGISPPRGIEWNHSSVLGLLRSPVLAGYLPDGKGDILRDDEGRPVVHGEPLLSANEWRELQCRIEPRKGRRPQQRSLLGGIAVCSGCGSTMGADRSQNQYRCNRSAKGLSCTSPARVPMRATDDYLMFVLRFSLHQPEIGPDARKALTRWWTLHKVETDVHSLISERDDIESGRARLRELYVAGDFQDDPAQYRKLFDAYERRLADVLGKLEGLESLPPSEEITRPGFIESLDLDTQRELFGAVLSIRCIKANRPGIRFDPADRLRVGLRVDDEILPLIVASAGDITLVIGPPT